MGYLFLKCLIFTEFYESAVSRNDPFWGEPEFQNSGLNLGAWHIGLVSRIIRDLDSVLLYVVKVRSSPGWIRTVCNLSNMENGLSLHIVLPDSAFDSFTTMAVDRS